VPPITPELIDHPKQVTAQAFVLSRLGEEAGQLDQLGLDGRRDVIVCHLLITLLLQ